MRPQRKPTPEIYGELTFDDVQMVIVLRGEDFRLEWLQERFKIDAERAKHLCLALLDDGVIEAVASTDLDAEPQYTVIAKLEDLTI